MATVYEVVTTRILELLERGTIPWVRPWQVGQLSPRSLISNRPYRGINILLTGSSGFESPYWLTYRQASDLGAQVKKGERGTPIVFWGPASTTREEVDGETVRTERWTGPFLKYFTVFNVSQVEGLRVSRETLFPVVARPSTPPNEAAERIISGFAKSPQIREGYSQACYNVGTDVISMPSRESFQSTEDYYATLFHEAVHASGHPARLHRDTLTKIARFGDHSYSKEELVAEYGSALLCAEAGISRGVIENQAAYIAGWVKVLKSDSRAVVSAAAAAQRAVDFILGSEPAATVEVAS